MSRHRAPRSTGRRGLLTVAVAALAVLGLTLPASAFFSVGSTAATGASRAGTLGTPGATASGVTATNVTFAITAPPTGPTPTAYRVARTAPTAAASVCTVTGSSGSCSDTAPVDGQTNTYAVYARLSGTTWESVTPRALSVVVPAADTTAPVTTASASPAPNAAGWNSTNVIVTLTATDASGVANTYYTTDGSVPSTSSTVYTGPFTVSSSATVRYFSVDTRGNVEAAKSLALRIDAVAPTGAVTSPAAAAVVGGTLTVSGTSTDAGSGVASVQPQVQQGSGAFTGLGAAVTTGASTWSTSWGTGAVADGPYSVRALVTDVAGNTFATPAVSVTVQNTTLTVSPVAATFVAGVPFNLTVRTGNNISGANLPITVTGLAASPNGTAAVVPTTANFTNGVATISVTAFRAGSQSIVVKLSSDNRQGGTTLTVNPKPGQLSVSQCEIVQSNGNTVSACGQGTVTLTNRNYRVRFAVARPSVDAYGNSLVTTSLPVSLNYTASTGQLGSLSTTSLSIPQDQTSSATLVTYNPPNNSASSGSISISATDWTGAVINVSVN